MIYECRDNQWDAFLKLFSDNQKDVYYSSWYNMMEQTRKQGTAKAFALKDSYGNAGFYPFIIRRIKESEYFDIETPYGYGGPIFNNNNEGFQHQFENEFLLFCQNKKVIAEFVRFHPLLCNENNFKENIHVLHNRKTVWIDLTDDINDIWMTSISTQNRNIIRKCEKNGLRAEITDDYTQFRKIYQQTMMRVGAEKSYFFEDDYYKALKSQSKTILLVVKKDNEILAAAIFIGFGDFFHYHLSGSKREALKFSPNNLLLWEAIKLGKAHGYKKMHLGGGLADSTEDSLFRFKSKFSKKYADFYIGMRIHNEKIYSKLIENWEGCHQTKAKILLQYREE